MSLEDDLGSPKRIRTISNRTGTIRTLRQSGITTVSTGIKTVTDATGIKTLPSDTSPPIRTIYFSPQENTGSITTVPTGSAPDDPPLPKEFIEALYGGNIVVVRMPYIGEDVARGVVEHLTKEANGLGLQTPIEYHGSPPFLATLVRRVARADGTQDVGLLSRLLEIELPKHFRHLPQQSNISYVVVDLGISYII